jgi:hypothetical protein
MTSAEGYPTYTTGSTGYEVEVINTLEEYYDKYPDADRVEGYSAPTEDAANIQGIGRAGLYFSEVIY